jgi:hypothetical protein
VSSLLRSSQVVYDVWVMTTLKTNRRIASKATLREAHKTITPEHRKEYVYILKWTPAFPKPVHIWGCLCNQVHTNDMRTQVRNILRS